MRKIPAFVHYIILIIANSEICHLCVFLSCLTVIGFTSSHFEQETLERTVRLWRWQPRKPSASFKPSCNLKLNLEGKALSLHTVHGRDGLRSDQKGFLVNTTLHWQSLSFRVHLCPSVAACALHELDLVWAVESLVSVGTTLASAALSCWWVVPWPGTTWKWVILSGQAKTEAYLRQNKGRSHPSSFGGYWGVLHLYSLSSGDISHPPPSCEALSRLRHHCVLFCILGRLHGAFSL